MSVIRHGWTMRSIRRRCRIHLTLTEIKRGGGVHGALAHLATANKEQDKADADDHDDCSNQEDNGSPIVGSEAESDKAIAQPQPHAYRTQDAMAQHELGWFAGSAEDQVC